MRQKIIPKNAIVLTNAIAVNTNHTAGPMKISFFESTAKRLPKMDATNHPSPVRIQTQKQSNARFDHLFR